MSVQTKRSCYQHTDVPDSSNTGLKIENALLFRSISFESIELCHKMKIEQIRKQYGHILSSHAFSSVYLWKDKMRLKLFLTENLFCIKREDRFQNQYFFPCGEEKEKIRLIQALIREGSVAFQYIRNEDKAFLEKHFPGRFEFSSAREDWEYIYDKREQIELSSPGYKHLRSKVHHGKNEYQWKTLKLTKDNLTFAYEVVHNWNHRSEDSRTYADIQATLTALDHYEELGLSGIILMAEQKSLAVALGTAITEDTFDLHISKTLVGNIDSYLKWELFRSLPDEIAYINREEDLGIEGLRCNKTQMKPIRFNELWKGWTKEV